MLLLILFRYISYYHLRPLSEHFLGHGKRDGVRAMANLAHHFRIQGGNRLHCQVSVLAVSAKEERVDVCQFAIKLRQHVELETESHPFHITVLYGF